VLDRAFGQPLRLEEKATAPFAGGIMLHGYQCGMIWGAALAAGAETYRRHGTGPKAEAAAIDAARRVVEIFRTRHGEIDCVEITDIDRSSTTWEMIHFFLLQGGTVGCFRMAAWYAPLALDAINAAMAEEGSEALTPPVSCAAMLARERGESEMHVVMAAGLAGGIGLCGGACGALGAAIWLESMKICRAERGRIGFKDPRTQALVERFLRHTDFELECAEIVGRKFTDVADHARYLRDGGCSELIRMLAAG
jgi:hypothetical protein